MIDSVFIPQDAYLLQKQVALASELGQSEYGVDRYFFAPGHAVNVLVLSIINCPLYLVRAVGHVITNIAQLDPRQMVLDLKEDLTGALKSLLTTALGTFYVVSGLLFPDIIFPFFNVTPLNPIPKIDYQEYVQKEEALEEAEEQVNQFEDEVRELTEQIAEIRTELSNAQSQASKASGLERRVDELTEELEDVRSEFSQAQKELTAAMELPDELRTKIEGLDRQLQKSSDDITKLQDSFREAEKLAKDRQEEIFELNGQIIDLRSELAEKQSYLDQSVEWIEKQNAASTTQKQTIAQQKQKIVKLEQEYHALKSKTKGEVVAIDEKTEEALESLFKRIEELSIKPEDQERLHWFVTTAVLSQRSHRYEELRKLSLSKKKGAEMSKLIEKHERETAELQGRLEHLILQVENLSRELTETQNHNKLLLKTLTDNSIPLPHFTYTLRV